MAAILDAGASLLHADGPDSITPAAVASAARVSRTTLYKHFPTRAELIVAVLEHVQPHDDFVATGDLRDDLVALVGDLAEAMYDAERRSTFASMLARAQWDPEMRAAEAHFRGGKLASLQAILDRAFADGDVAVTLDAEQVAARLVGPMLFRALVFYDGTPRDEVVDTIDAWLDSVRPDPRADD